jgi:5-methylcytosine-specific restriction enzyme A
MKLTVQEYQDAIKNSLSSRQIETLQILYSFPNSQATAVELTKVLSPSSSEPIVGAGAIGRIGKALSAYLNFIPESYYDRGQERPAYFSLVGPYTDNGYEMVRNLQNALENLELTENDNLTEQLIDRLPTETMKFDERTLYKEGKVAQIFVDRYERNQKARLECINHYGNKCYVCGFDFGQFYGSIAQGFIHVHHKNQLSEIGSEYEVDPIKDLIPVCANCHSVIHLTKIPMSIQEIKKRIKAKTK